MYVCGEWSVCFQPFNGNRCCSGMIYDPDDAKFYLIGSATLIYIELFLAYAILRLLEVRPSLARRAPPRPRPANRAKITLEKQVLDRPQLLGCEHVAKSVANRSVPGLRRLRSPSDSMVDVT